MRVGSVVKIVLLLLATSPLFSQTITIDTAKLQAIIAEEVQKGISTAVDQAVAVAVKSVELKYIDIIAGKDTLIADKQLEINLLAIDKSLLTIQKANLQMDFDAYKQKYGLRRDLIIGGVSMSIGMVGGLVAFVLITK
jgi:hypothetical protein